MFCLFHSQLVFCEIMNRTERTIGRPITGEFCSSLEIGNVGVKRLDNVLYSRSQHNQKSPRKEKQYVSSSMKTRPYFVVLLCVIL